MTESGQHHQLFRTLSCCVIIPTYNNALTLDQLLQSVMTYTDQVIVVNDGSDDLTHTILRQYPDVLTIHHQHNTGKGKAIRSGFKEAINQGFRYAITIDSDGQHFAKDLPLFLEKIQQYPDSLIIGARNMTTTNIPRKSSFGNRFSNFWFHVETGIKLPDTQSGYRLYPLTPIKKMKFFTSKFEFEIEVIVRLAWKSVNTISVPVSVAYTEDRVSHFRPFKDFTRISILNTVLVTLALLWYRWYLAIRKLSWEGIKRSCWDKNEPVYKKGLAISIGVMSGILPIWGFQTATAIGTAYVMRVNKLLTFIASNISLPPFIPFIIYGSLVTGAWITGSTEILPSFDENFDFQSAKQHLIQYLIGSILLAIIAGGVSFFLSILIINIFKRR